MKCAVGSLPYRWAVTPSLRGPHAARGPYSVIKICFGDLPAGDLPVGGSKDTHHEDGGGEEGEQIGGGLDVVVHHHRREHPQHPPRARHPVHHAHLRVLGGGGRRGISRGAARVIGGGRR
eukprot:1191615-Prorocentrum_minimum.AAC.6